MTTPSQDRGAFDYHIWVGGKKYISHPLPPTPPLLVCYPVSSFLDRTRTTVDAKLRIRFLLIIYNCGIFPLNDVGGPNQTFLKLRRMWFLNKFAKGEEDDNNKTEFIYRV